MSQIYYHVDRKNKLSQGDVMEYVTSLDGIDVLEEEYPKGFTRHGWLYFTKHPHDFAVVEWFLEFIRLKGCHRTVGIPGLQIDRYRVHTYRNG